MRVQQVAKCLAVAFHAPLIRAHCRHAVTIRLKRIRTTKPQNANDALYYGAAMADDNLSHRG